VAAWGPVSLHFTLFFFLHFFFCNPEHSAKSKKKKKKKKRKKESPAIDTEIREFLDYPSAFVHFLRRMETTPAESDETVEQGADWTLTRPKNGTGGAAGGSGSGTSRARFKWRLHGVAARTGVVRSTTFEVGGQGWHIAVYPRGNNVDHLSVFLAADAAGRDRGWHRRAGFRLAVVRQRGWWWHCCCGS
jgi:hypothetical protein